MSIRLRLTLIYTIILALLLVLINVTFYFGQAQAMARGERIILRSTADRIIGAWPAPIPDRDEPDRDDRTRPRRNWPTEMYVQTRNLDGDLIQSDADLDGLTLPLSEEGRQAVQQGQRWTETVTLDTEQFLVHNESMTEADGTTIIIQVAMSLAHRDRFQGTFRNVLIIGSIVILGLVFGVSWILAGLALRPIHRITQTAQEIGAERDFSRRVEHPGPNDEIGQLVTTFNDMLTELQDAYAQVEQSLQIQQRFVADASHELRTPLTTLRGNIGLLRREPPISEEDRADVLDDMVDETERLMRLTNDLLVLARADAKRPLKNEAVAIKPLLDEVTDQIRFLGPQRTIVYESCPAAAIMGDEDALRQILLALLDNALKHTSSKVTITLSGKVDDERVTISVQDDGPGIEPERLPFVFDRFYRGDDARPRGSTGLGLTIAKELTEAQNGTIVVESEVGQGSVFTLTFPKVQANGPRKPPLP